MLYLEKMAMHTITAANYVTSVNGMLHPDRILSEHDFLYIIDGTFEIWEDASVYELQSDDLIILTAGRHHFGKKPCNPGNRHMYVHALPTAAESEANDAMASTTAADPTAGPQAHASAKTAVAFPSVRMDKAEGLLALPTLLHCRKNPQIRQYFHEIIAECWSDSPEQSDRLSLLFSLLLCELSRIASQPEALPAPDPMVEEIAQRVRTTPQKVFLAKEIADSYYISERTLNNRFYKYYGKSFFAFQMDTRLEMVRQFLLAQPQAKLHEAAVNYGFYDEFHLCRAFKKRYGQPPSAFRKQ